MNTYLKHLIGSLFLTAGLALSGCGTDSSPIASSDQVALDQGTARMAFQLLTPAAKTTGDEDDDKDEAKRLEKEAKKLAKEAKKLAKEAKKLAKEAEELEENERKEAEKAAERLEKEAEELAEKAKEQQEEANERANERRAADQQIDKNRTRTKVIGTDGGTISVGHKNLNRGSMSLKAMFHVPEGALDQEVPITMTLHGETLTDLVLEFAPSGLVFNTPARLTLLIGKERCPEDIEGMVVLHIHSDGTVEEARWTFDTTEMGYKIDIAVPGFSRYSGGGGW